MEETKNTQNKLSYEELQTKLTETMNQMRFMQMQMTKFQEALAYKRLDYLFKVMENSHLYNPDFTDLVVKEIEETLTIESKTFEEEPQ